MAMKDRRDRGDRKDGGWGWVVVLGGFVIGFLCDGIRNSYGFIYLEFLREFKESKSVTSWVGSIMFGLMNFLGPVTSILVHRFGCRAVTVCGSGICALGYVASVFVTTVHHLYLSLGVLGGIGFSMLIIPFNVIIVQYFEKRRALAMGIAVCGSGVGSIVFSPLSKMLIDEFGWRGTLLIQGALVLNCVPCGLVMRPIVSKMPQKRFRAEAEGYEVNKPLLKNNVNLKTTVKEIEVLPPPEISTDSSLIQIDPQTAVEKTRHSKHDTEKSSSVKTIDAESSSDEANTVSHSWLREFKNLFHVSLLTNVAFLLMLVSYLCEGLVYSVPFTFLPDMAVSWGYTRLNATWLLSAIAIANTASRIPVGMLGDLRCVNRLYMYLSALACVGACIILMAFAKAYIGLICVCVFYGIFLGSYVVLLPLVLADLFGDDLIADTKGFTCFTNGIAGLIGLPVAGALFDVSGEYTMSFVGAGLMYILGGAVLILVNRFKYKTLTPRL